MTDRSLRSSIRALYGCAAAILFAIVVLIAVEMQKGPAIRAHSDRRWNDLHDEVAGLRGDLKARCPAL